MGEEWGSPGDRAISTLAIVKVSFDRHASFLSYFEPFLEHCMLKSQHDLVSIPDLQSAIDSRFGLFLPQAVIKTLLRRQEGRGHVAVRSNTCRIQREKLGAADLEPDRREAMRQQGALLKALIDFANDELDSEGRPWKRVRAQEMLLGYVKQFSARLLDATMAGGELPAVDPNWERDQHIVHTFVLHAEAEDPRSFEFLTGLVKGQMLIDAVYLGEREIRDGVEPLSDVEVYLDTPILLRLLGYAGKEMSTPYLELLEMLKKQNANVRCFDTNIAEARRILRAAERGARGEGAERGRGDVVAFLARTASPSDIALKSSRLSSDLLKLGIQPVEIDRLRPDRPREAAALSRKLRGRKPEYGDRALQTDVEAVLTVSALRKGAAALSLPKCRAVFITRNYDLYLVSREVFFSRDESVPLCIPMSAFTTMVWVREPLSAPGLPEERIIADAYAAMNPDREEWRVVNDQAVKLRADGDVSMGEAHDLRVRGEVDHALAGESADGEEPYLEGTVDQVTQWAEEWARNDSERRRQRLEGRASWVGRLAARLLFAAVVPLLCLGVVYGPLGVFGSAPSFISPPIQWVGTALFLAVSVASIIDGISLGRRARRTATFLEGIARRIALRLGRYPATQ